MRCSNISQRDHRTSLHKIPYSNNSLEASQFAISRSELIFAKASAIFDGIGIAGLISAAFWYATAPMAPDGFKGPISTFTIAVSTVASLFIAIPIAQNSYKKIIEALNNCYSELSLEHIHLNQNYEDLLFTLLTVRCLFASDGQFKLYIKPILQEYKAVVTTSLLQRICELYVVCDKYKFTIKWQASKKFEPIIQKANDINSMSILQLIKDNILSNNIYFRKEIMKLLQNSLTCHATLVAESLIKILHPINNRKYSIKKFLFYCVAPIITCSEVLLGIFWTVLSILIGIHVITPISSFSWGMLVIICIISGMGFGIMLYFSKKKQTHYGLVKEEIKRFNSLLIKILETISNLHARQFFENNELTLKVLVQNYKAQDRFN